VALDAALVKTGYLSADPDEDRRKLKFCMAEPSMPSGVWSLSKNGSNPCPNELPPTNQTPQPSRHQENIHLLFNLSTSRKKKKEGFFVLHSS